MCQELFGLSDLQLLRVQACALLTCAGVHAAGQRTLLQRYLDRALTGAKQAASRGRAALRLWTSLVPRPAGWHHLKHGSLAARAKKDDKKSLADLIRASCHVRRRPPAVRVLCALAAAMTGTYER